MKTSRERSEMMSLRARPEEVAMLDALAEHTGLSKSAILWQLVRKEHRKVFGDVVRKTKRRGAR